MQKHEHSQGIYQNSEIRIISENMRGFHINVGDLTHQFANNQKANTVFAAKIFLDDTVPLNYVRVSGYSNRIQREKNMKGGGIAFRYNYR